TRRSSSTSGSMPPAATGTPCSRSTRRCSRRRSTPRSSGWRSRAPPRRLGAAERAQVVALFLQVRDRRPDVLRGGEVLYLVSALLDLRDVLGRQRLLEVGEGAREAVEAVGE